MRGKGIVFFFLGLEQGFDRMSSNFLLVIIITALEKVTDRFKKCL